MNMAEIDPNLQLLAKVADALDPLVENLVFIGGCVVALLSTDPAQLIARPTEDVDVIARAATREDFLEDVERRLEELGWRRDDSEEAPSCRWKYLDLTLDVMPTQDVLVGPVNRWYEEAFANAQSTTLSQGRTIRIISAPAFVATKLEAFANRGNNDFLASHDLEDVIAIVDGRADLADELRRASPALRRFVAQTFRRLLADHRFHEAMSGQLPPDAASQKRLPLLMHRLTTISEIT